MIIDKKLIDKNIKLLGDTFVKILNEVDEQFVEGMKNNNLAGDSIKKYILWEWTQGVGLYGFYKLYKHSQDEKSIRGT